MDLNTFESIRSKLSLAELGKPALIGIAALLVMVAVLAGRNLMGTATANEFEIQHSASSPAEDFGGENSRKATEEETTIFVHVSGAVAVPGLYEVAKGSRLASAVDAAGGFAEEAQIDSVNLARILEDGEKVVVLSATDGNPAGETSTAQGLAESIPAVQAGSSLVNINTASAEQLETLPGVGPSTAQRIVADRAANGSYKTIEDLKRVSGIGDKKYEAIASLICV